MSFTEPTQQPAAESHVLKKELRLRDLVLMQVVLVVGITWSGIAARQGPNHVWFWILGIVAIFIPQAMVVQYAAQIWPLEGGVYQWTKYALGPFAGFMAAWNFALWALFAVSNLSILFSSSVAFALGSRWAWIADDKHLITGLNFLLFGVILAVTIPGFRIGKWANHFAAAVTLFLGASLAVLIVYHPGASRAHPHVSPQLPISFAFPAITLMSINLFSKMCNSALTGLEQLAVFAGETRDPGRSIMRSAWIGAPLTALIYILMTVSMLTYTPASQIDLAAPVPQVLAAAFGGSGGGAPVWIVLLGRCAIFALALSVVAQYSVIIAATSRLPLVAGWDHLVPQWFTRLHPRYRTPTRSIYFITLCALALGLGSLYGAGHEEAFQLINGGSVASYGIYYVLFFAVPIAVLFSKKLRGLPRPGFWLVLSALSGIFITLLGVVFALKPIIYVSNQFIFGLKVGVVTLAVNVAGALLYLRGVRRKKAEEAVAVQA
ncbi:MAG: APC family permease [Acidobacteriaceae bacterium]|nr:APC family permease [Acidobacteriaceae bacterium]